MSAEREQLDEWARGVAEQAERMGATEHLRAAVVRVRINRRRSPLAPDLPTRPAGADEPEADPPQTVAADPSVVDSESDTVYGDAVQHESEYRPEARGEAGRAEEVPHDGRASARPAQSEHERQAWLRRVQAQPIR